MEDLKKELLEAQSKMEEAKELKNKAVKNQQWERAADYRDQERQWIYKIEKLNEKLNS